MRPEVTVVVPTYNEARIIVAAIERLEAVLDKIRVPYELIISDDCSRDSTVALIKSLMKTDRRLRLVTSRANRGYGEAVSAGFVRSKGRFLIHVDADLSTDVRKLADLIRYLKTGYGMVIGSRYTAGSQVRRKPFRKLTSFMYRVFVRVLFGTHITDHATGFKGYTRELFFSLLDDVGITKANVRGISWGTEIALRAERKACRIREFPVDWLEGKKSEIKVLKEGIKIMRYLLHLRVKFWRE